MWFNLVSIVWLLPPVSETAKLPWDCLNFSLIQSPSKLRLFSQTLYWFILAQHLPKNLGCDPPPNSNITEDDPCSTVYQKHKCMCNTMYLCPLRYASVHTPNMKIKSNKCDSVLLDTSAYMSQLCSILEFISQWFAYRNFARWKFDA